jgi:hypothetical protein
VKKAKIYRYVIDGVTRANLPTLSKALQTVPVISGVSFALEQKILTIESTVDPAQYVTIACQIAAAVYRQKVS